MKKVKTLVALGACLSMVFCLSFSASAKTLAHFEANENWTFVSGVTDKEDMPSIGTSEDGVTSTQYFSMQDSVCVGEYDFSNGNPTKLTFSYAIGSPQSEMGDWIHMYIVIGDDPMAADRWWAGPYDIHSTIDWDLYEEQTWDFEPGTGLEWPTGKQKIWVHNSNVGGINLQSVTFSNEEPEESTNGTENEGSSTTANSNPSTGEKSLVLGMLSLALVSGATVYGVVRSKRNKK